MNVRSLTFCLLFPTMLGSVLWASRSNNAPDDDPSHWTGQEVYKILNKSPWTEPVKLKLASADSNAFGSQAPASAPPAPVAGGAGGGRRGGRSATYNSGSRNAPSPTSGNSGPAEVKIQWQSAEVVRLAELKKAEEPAKPTDLKPLDEYVIAIIGLPITAVGGRAASADGDTLGGDEGTRIQNNVKSAASLLPSGHNAIAPTKVELDQGRDGRMLIHFPKTDRITAEEKTVEFRLAIGKKTELRKKFVLKDMEFQGKLEL